MSPRFSLILLLMSSGAWLSSQMLLADEPNKSGAKPVKPFELFKKLDGEWTGKASHGEVQFDSKVQYRVTSAGSAVMETLFGGSEHEMVTLYHQNGDDLLLTHYCAAGNQPRMKAIKSDNPRKIEFKYLDGTNLDAAKDMHMHEMTIEFVDEDHIKTEWITYVGGKPAAEKAKFELQRVKKGASGK